MNDSARDGLHWIFIASPSNSQPRHGRFCPHPHPVLQAGRSLSTEKGAEMFGLWRAGGTFRQGPTVSSPLVFLFVSCGILGCSDYGPPKNTEGLQNLQPVSGSVSFEGQPTPGALVLFFPADEPESPFRRIAGVVDEDGSFQMQTTVGEGSRPGVEPGEYLVTISWSEPVNPYDHDSDLGPEKLPEKYQDYKTSNLRVEIVQGTNEILPFELTP